MKLANISIKYKLTLINLLAVCAVMILIMAAAVISEYQSQKQSLQHELDLQGKILASNSAAAVAFRYQTDAVEILQALNVYQPVHYAAIYLPDDSKFAEYRATSNDHRQLADVGRSYIENDQRMGVSHPIELSDKVLGQVYLEADYSFIADDVFNQALWVFAVLLVILSIMLVMLYQLQKHITDPLLELSRLMQKVTSDRSYSVRSTLTGEDEVGKLSQGFNNMLSQIQQRDNQLVEHHNQLEKTVALRTASLTEAQRIARLGNWQWNLLDQTLEWSDELFRILGMDPREAEADYEALLNAVHPDDRVEVQELFEQVFNQCQGESLEHRILLPDGSVRFVRQQIEVVAKEQQQIVSLTGTIQDITEQHEMMLEMKKNEELWGFALEGSGDCVWDWNLATGQVKLSEIAESMLGYSGEELTDDIKVWYQRVFPADRYRWHQMARRIKQETVQRFSLEYRLRCKDGHYIWVLTRGMTVENFADGGTARMIGVHTDIDQRKQAEDRLAMFGRIFDASERAIIVADSDWKIVYVNPAFEQLYGYQSSEIMQQSFTSLCPDADEQQHFQQAVSQGESWDGMLKQIRKDQSEFTSASSIGVIRDDQGDPRYYFNILYDYTSEIARQQELKLAKEKADAASRSKSEFLSNMSHEIRTPMNAIIGLSQLCLQTQLSPKQLDYLNKISSSAQSLLGILNDILDFSKIEAGKLTIEQTQFEVAEVLNNVSMIISTKTEEKGLSFNISLAPEIVETQFIGDPMRLGQVLINLLGNAVKFTEEGSIDLNVSVDKRSDAQMTMMFKVSDTGIGMTQEQLSRLFHAFSQADASTSRKFGGTGLGLTISKNLIEMMGGSITVDSQLYQGSIFTFTITCQVCEVQSEQQLLSKHALEGLRVLVADDEASSRCLLNDLLLSLSCEVDSASNGLAARNAIINADRDDSPYDLVILDWKMPKIGGVTLAQQLYSMPDLNCKPKVLLISAFDSAELKTYLEGGFIDGVLTKPIVKTQLHREILKAFDLEEGTQASGNQLFDRQTADSLQGARLLLVEDNEINQQVARELLNKAGVQVVVADNGKKALELLEQREFDGVLMDMQMPVMDGLSATRVIRQQSCYESLPIIAMTANALNGDKERCLQAGMDDHIAKPFKAEHLVTTLSKWVKVCHEDESQQGEDQPDASAEGLPVIEGVTQEEGLKHCQGDLELYLEKLSSFYKNYPEWPPEIEQLYHQEKLDAALKQAHDIYELLQQMGAMQIAALVQQLQQYILQQQDGSLQRLLPALKDQFARLISQIGAVVKQQPGPPAQAKATTTAAMPPLNGRHFILAEDNMMNRMVLEDTLSTAGATFDSFQDGQAALDYVLAHLDSHWDLVLTDVQMPHLDGFGLARQLKQHCPQLPVIGVTAAADEAQREQCLQSGMSDCVSKPLRLTDIQQLLDQYASRLQEDQEDGNEAEADSVEQTQTSSLAQLSDWIAVDDLLQEFDQRLSFIQQLLKVLIKNHGDFADKVEQVAANQDFKQMASMTHSFAGVSGQIFAVNISQQAKAVEQAAKSEDPAVWAQSQALAQEAGRFVDAVAQYLSDPGEDDAADEEAHSETIVEDKTDEGDSDLSQFLNWSELLEEFSGRQAFVDKLLKVLIKNQSVMPEQLLQATENKDFDTLARVSHSIAGVTGQLQAIRLNNLARSTEYQARQQDKEALHSAQLLAEELSQLLQAVRQYLNKT